MATFKEVYEEAKKIYLDPEEAKHKPANPEVRYYGDGEWELESGLNSAEDVEICCDLETFDTYFWNCYDGQFELEERDEKEFLSALREWVE